MIKSTIQIEVELDDQRIPQQIRWNAAGTTSDQQKIAKCIMLSIWDGNEKNVLRMDLWTKEMMIDEMADFFYQSFMTMADTYQRSTRNEELSEEIKKFAHEFYRKFRETELNEKSE